MVVLNQLMKSLLVDIVARHYFNFGEVMAVLLTNLSGQCSTVF